MNNLLFILHSFSLVILNLTALNWKRKDFPFLSISVFILIWFELILTGYSCSILNQLSNKNLYVFLSLVYAALFNFIIRKYFVVNSVGNSVEERVSIRDLMKNEIGFIFFGIIILGIVFASFLICIFYYPNNADTIAYRLPRVFFYKAHNNLLHYTQDLVDPRLNFYYLNGVLAHMLPAIHGLSVMWLHMFTFLSWVFIMITTYGINKELGFSRTASIFAAFVTGSAPALFVISSAGNDELLAGAPLLIGFYFGYIWIKRNENLAWLLATLSISISVGVKEHYLLYFIFCIFLFLILIINKKIFALLDFIKGKLFYFIFSSILILLSIVSSPIINYISAGKTSGDFAAQAINYPINLFLPIQNFTLYSLQMFLTPIPDLNFWIKNIDLRLEMYKHFNTMYTNLLFWVDQPTFKGYPFSGLLMPESFYRNEATVWFGVTPYFLVIAFIVFRKSEKWKDTFCSYFLASFLLWVLGLSLVVLFAYTIQSYITYPFLFLAPIWAILWNESKTLSYKKKIVMHFLVFILIITSLIQIHNILRDNVSRSLRTIIHKKFHPFSLDEMNEELINLIKKEERIQLLFTHWEMPFLNIIARNPLASYSTIRGLETNPNFLSLVIIQARSDYGLFPIKIKNKKTVGLTLVGSLNDWYGKELVFAHAKEVTGFTDNSTIILSSEKSFDIDAEKNKTIHIKISSPHFSAENSEDNLEFKFILKNENEKLLTESNWESLYQKYEVRKKIKEVSLKSAYEENINLEILVKEKNSKEINYYYFPLRDGLENNVTAPNDYLLKKTFEKKTTL